MRAIILILLICIASNHAQAQNNQSFLSKFWESSDYRVTNKLMSEVSRSIYFNLTRKYYPDKSFEALVSKIENIRKDSKLQDYLLLKFLETYGNGELLRLQLANVSGSQIMGNKVADYIVKRYSNDKRYLDFLKLSKEKKVIADSITTDNTYKDLKQDTTFTKIEIEAEFPGGSSQWAKYLQTELAKLDDLPNVHVVIKYIIGKEGNIVKAEMETPIDENTDNKLLSIFLNSPKWKPATQNGKPVNAYRKQPITLGGTEE